ncbi:MAG: 3-oxoacyl-ACP reductase FabG [Planctomycetia bacterium]|nr:3-oxoacyl-ACP reductase FabG [Planctomycetia bacterium]
MNSKNRIALVTGASKGVGRGIALGLAAAGWDVIVNYNRDESGAAETAAEVRAFQRQCWTMQADVGDGGQVQAMFAEIQRTAGRIELLVNNAGVQTWAPLVELREEDWDRTIRTNLKGCFLCMQQAARLMLADGEGGSIINIGSGANTAPFPSLIDYCASKGGIQNLTRVAAVELGPHRIRVNCVAPGAIEIERTRQESPDYAKTWSPLTPLRQIGEVTDVADAVVFLASPAARHITAQTLYVDGGLWAQGPWPYA